MNKVVLKGKIGLFSELPQKVIFYICQFLNRHDTLLLSELNHTFYRLIDNYLLYQTKLSYVELKSNKANACSSNSFGRIIAHVAKMFTFNHTKCQTAEKIIRKYQKEYSPFPRTSKFYCSHCDDYETILGNHLCEVCLYVEPVCMKHNKCNVCKSTTCNDCLLVGDDPDGFICEKCDEK